MRYFERAHTASIIIILYNQKDKIYHKQLLELLGFGGGVVSETLRHLKNLNLIYDETEDKFAGKRYIWLTEKGKRVAKHLVEIEKIMEKK